MKLAAMQPYLFPYMGYYQLVHAVDTFVFLDDVNHIKGGYINRNYTLSPSGEKIRFTLPILGQTQNRAINQHEFSRGEEKILKTLRHCHGKSRFFSRFMPIIENTLRENDRNVAHLSARSIINITEELKIPRTYIFSSQIGNPDMLSASDRIIDLCHRLEATEYINAIGGASLYDKNIFKSHGVKLNFINMRADRVRYNNCDLSQLSIIDALMTCPENVILEMLGAYDLI